MGETNICNVSEDAYIGGKTILKSQCSGFIFREATCDRRGHTAGAELIRY